MNQSKSLQAPVPPPDRNRFRLNGQSVKLDRRVHAVRKDLADLSLAGTLFAPHYARALAMSCASAGAMVHEKPEANSVAVTQLLRGEAFHVLDVSGAWAWGFCGHDGYVGYVRSTALMGHQQAATHRISSLSAPVFALPDIKAPISDFWPAGAVFAGVEEGQFLSTDAGFVHHRHVGPASVLSTDALAVAERYLGMPYVWGGRGHGGIDCSGLIQLCLAACGHQVPRDTDLQRDSIGFEIPEEEALRRGDIVFFPGHVGFMRDDETLLHANAHWMAVVAEPLADVIARLAGSYERPVLARRRIA